MYFELICSLPQVFEDDDGSFYIIAGVFNYYIAKLNEDMISLARD